MDQPPKQKTITRQEFLKGLKSQYPELEKGELSAFSKRAIKGIQYLPAEKDRVALLKQIDWKIDRKIRTLSGSGRKPAIRRVFLPLAAVVLLVITAVFIIRLSSSGPEQLFTAYFEPLPCAIPENGIARDLPYSETNEKKQAILAYEMENYPEAVSHFEAYLSQNPDDRECRFYFGIALLANRNAGQATDVLSGVYAQLPDPSYQAATLWYLSLGHLLAGQAAQAKKGWEELAGYPNDYTQQAGELLSKQRF